MYSKRTKRNRETEEELEKTVKNKEMNERFTTSEIRTRVKIRERY